MKQSTEDSRVSKKRDGHTSEELVHLHETIFKDTSPMYENSGFVGFPPGFEFKKMTIWKDVPSTYSTSTITENHLGNAVVNVARQ
jgi:hypothetical protein